MSVSKEKGTPKFAYKCQEHLSRIVKKTFKIDPVEKLKKRKVEQESWKGGKEERGERRGAVRRKAILKVRVRIANGR